MSRTIMIIVLCLATGTAAQGVDLLQQKLDLADLLDQHRRLENPSDYFYEAGHPSVRDAFWVFGDEGLKIFSKDGASLVHSIDSEHICGASCSFRDAVTDLEKYVFVSNTAGGAWVEVFGIETGLYYGHVQTCRSPFHLDYVPHREEVWVHCWGPNEEDGDTGHVLAFPIHARGTSYDQINLVNGSMDTRGHGMVVLDASSPNYAWASLLSSPTIAKIDAQTREAEVIDLSSTGCAGFYRMAIASGNQHAFARCAVCCSCGVDGDTGVECSGRARDVQLRDGTVAPGHCGHTCDGSKADTIGLIEFDLVAARVVTNHYFETIGSANPHSSPDGKTMAFMAESGAVTRLLDTSGQNGRWSSGYIDIETGFADDNAMNDIEFITDNERDWAIITSTLDNYVVVANLATGATAIVVLSDAEESTSNHGRGSRRLAVWAQGTQYVMISGNARDELYVLDLSQGDVDRVVVTKTITSVSSRPIVYVPPGPSTAPQSASSSSDDDDNDFRSKYKLMLRVALILAVVSIILTLFVCVIAVVALNTARTIKEVVFLKSEQNFAGGGKHLELSADSEKAV